MALKHRRSYPQGAKASEAIEAAPNAVSKCPIKQIEPYEQGQEPHGRQIQLEGAGEPPEGQRGLPLTAQLKPRIGLAQGRGEAHLGARLGKKKAWEKALQTTTQGTPGLRLRQRQLHSGKAIGRAKPFLRRG